MLAEIYRFTVSNCYLTSKPKHFKIKINAMVFSNSTICKHLTVKLDTKQKQCKASGQCNYDGNNQPIEHSLVQNGQRQSSQTIIESSFHLHDTSSIQQKSNGVNDMNAS